MPTISPPTTTLDGVPLPARVRAVVIGAGQAPVVRYQLRDQIGNPVDITAYVSPPGGFPTPAPGAPALPPTIQLRAAEAVSRGSSRGYATMIGGAVDQATGLVQAQVDVTQLAAAGIYEAAFGVYDVTGVPAVVETFYLVLEPNLFGSTPYGGLQAGPPRIDEVRLHIRDSSPEENRLLAGTTLFDDAEVAASLVKALQAWNTALPPVALFDTVSFPRAFHYAWIEGATAQLLFTAAEWYRKNYLPVQGAGGVAVPDMDKADTCDRSAMRRWQSYLDWVKAQKRAINVGRGFGRMGSAYRLISWSSIINP